MGLGEIFGNILGSGKKREFQKGKDLKCPSCGAKVTLDMERCPSCGVRIKSMFKRKCPNPKCLHLNDLDAKKCEKCGYNFMAELERAKRTYFVCPICGYKTEAYLTQCPACGTRFV